MYLLKIRKFFESLSNFIMVAGLQLALSANPFAAMTLVAQSAIGGNSSIAVTESAPIVAAIMERSPVPVPMSSTWTGAPRARRSDMAERRPS